MPPNKHDDYVSLLMIPRKLFEIFIWLFSIIVISYTVIQLINKWELLINKWELNVLGNTFPTQISTLMGIIVGYFFVLSNIWSIVMLLYDWISNREKIKQQSKAEGKAERDLQWLHWVQNGKDPDKMPAQFDHANIQVYESSTYENYRKMPIIRHLS